MYRALWTAEPGQNVSQLSQPGVQAIGDKKPQFPSRYLDAGSVEVWIIFETPLNILIGYASGVRNQAMCCKTVAPVLLIEDWHNQSSAPSFHRNSPGTNHERKY